MRYVPEGHGPVASVHPGWSTEQRARFDRYAQQGDLFQETPPALLDPPRFKGTLKYTCQHDTCSGHQQGIIDWGFTALQHRFRRESDESLEVVIMQNFYAQILSATPPRSSLWVIRRIRLSVAVLVYSECTILWLVRHPRAPCCSEVSDMPHGEVWIQLV